MRVKKILQSLKKLFEEKPLSQLEATDLVTRAANRLDSSEFEVFLKAYEWWFGRKAGEEQIEKIFRDYLKDETVPPFVVQFARTTLLS